MRNNALLDRTHAIVEANNWIYLNLSSITVQLWHDGLREKGGTTKRNRWRLWASLSLLFSHIFFFYSATVLSFVTICEQLSWEHDSLLYIFFILSSLLHSVCVSFEKSVVVCPFVDHDCNLLVAVWWCAQDVTRFSYGACHVTMIVKIKLATNY